MPRQQGTTRVLICIIENQANDGWRGVHQACTTAYLYHPPAMLCVSALVSCGRLQNSKALVMLCVSCLVSFEYPALQVLSPCVMLCVKRLASFVHRTSLPASMSPRADAKSAPCFSPRFPPLKMWNRLCMGQSQEQALAWSVRCPMKLHAPRYPACSWWRLL